jgi:hypothetical protein
MTTTTTTRRRIIPTRTTIIPVVAAMPSSKAGTFAISSKMQKEIQCVGSGLVLDKLHVENEMRNILQDQFIYKSFHGEKNNTNTIRLVETIITGKGIVSDMFYSREPGIVDQNTPTKSTSSCLQIKDSCTLDPGKVYKVGDLITTEMLHGSTKMVGGPWIVGKSLHVGTFRDNFQLHLASLEKVLK